MSDPVVRKRGGENCPAWRDRESQADLLAELAGEAVREAIVDGGVPPYRVRVETRYHQGRSEPHTSYGEVRVFDTDGGAGGEPGTTLILSPAHGDARRLRIRPHPDPGVVGVLREDQRTEDDWRFVGVQQLERVEIDGDVWHEADGAESYRGP